MSLLQPLDNYGAAVVTLKVNKLLSLSSFARSGQDSGITSPRSAECTPLQETSLTRDSCLATLGEPSTRCPLLHEEGDYVCVDCPPNDDSCHGKLLALGGPNFSVALLSPENGELERIPIPLAKSQASVEMDPMGFATSSITCAHIVGDRQIWIGTEQGTLHVFDFCPLSNTLANHQFIDMKEKALCIGSRAAKRSNGREEVEAVVGFPHGYMVAFTGALNGSGGLENLLTAQRHVVRLIPPNSKQASSLSPVTNVLYISSSVCSETYWCMCGEKLIVLNATTWQQEKEMSVTQQASAFYSQQSSVLVDSEVGVWCALSSSPCVTLWNKTTYAMEAQVATCKTTTDPASIANVTALAFQYPHLFIGTNGGHVLVFELVPSKSKGKVKGCGKELRFAAAEGLQLSCIVDILCQPMTSLRHTSGLSFSDSPSEQSVEVLVLGQCPDSSSSDYYTFSLLRRLKFIPKPTSLRRSSSQSSTPSNSRRGSPSSIFLPRKALSSNDGCSSSLDFPSPIQSVKLTLSTVSPTATTFLPLKH